MKTGATGLAGILAGECDGGAEMARVDVRAAGAKAPARHLDPGRQDDPDRDGSESDDGARRERERGVHRDEHEGCHRPRERGGDQAPQRRAQTLAIVHGAVRADVDSSVLHYPRCVTESVDVLIMAREAPLYAHPGDAGADLVAAEAVRLEPGERALVGTGVRIALPDGHVGFVVPRSGLASKHGITVVNAPGTVDAGYRGEVKVALLNTDPREPYTIREGDRIAQLIVMPIPPVRFVPVDELPDSTRGDGGFGSTGYQKDGASS